MQNLTRQEYSERKGVKAEGGAILYVLKVAKGKTAQEGRAKLVLTEAFNNRMDSYLNTIRPRLMSGAQGSPFFFFLPGGRSIDQLRARLAPLPLAKRFQVGHFSANQVRQAAATQAADTLPAG